MLRTRKVDATQCRTRECIMMAGVGVAEPVASLLRLAQQYPPIRLGPHIRRENCIREKNMRKLTPRTLAALLWLTSVPMAQADSVIQVEDPWARETPPGVRHGAAYMTLVNQGSATDRLIGAHSGVSNVAELHTHLMEDGVVKMRRLEGLNVPPGTPTVLEPGGLHIMLIDLKEPLAAGEHFPLTLEFERSGDATVAVEVRKPGG